MLLICENKYIVALSQLEGTYRLSYIQVHTKEVLASESIYFKVVGMFVSQACPKNILLYTANEVYVVGFGAEIKPVSVGVGKFLQATNQNIVEAISSLFTGSDIQVYMITNGGNLLFININVVTNKIINVDTLSLGEF